MALLGACLLSGETLTLPGSAAGNEGNSTVFLGGFFGASTTQIQVSAAELGTLGLLPGHTLWGLRLRLGGGSATNANAVVISDLEILLGQAANSISNMSTTFASNLVNGTLVHDGAYTFAANSLPGGATPNAFGEAIPFSLGYVYQGGDLVIEIRRQAASANLNVDASNNHAGAGVEYRALGAGGFGSLTGTLSDQVPVIALDYAVPEPGAATLVLLGLGLVGVGGYRRRKR